MSESGKWKVLIADDDERVRRRIKSMIPWEQLNLSVPAMVSDGSEAIEYLKENKAEILITDMRMPRCGGIELMQWCHDNCPKIKCIVISKYRYFDYAYKAFRYGVDHYLLKPVDQKKLIESLKDVEEKLEAEIQEVLACRQISHIRSIREYIDNHYSEDISLNDVADHVKLSVNYVSSIFRKETGVTFRDYLTSKRMDTAARLLRKSNLSIREIAEKVGYRDARCFSKIYKKNLGINPSTYRSRYA